MDQCALSPTQPQKGTERRLQRYAHAGSEERRSALILPGLLEKVVGTGKILMTSHPLCLCSGCSLSLDVLFVFPATSNTSKEATSRGIMGRAVTGEGDMGGK